MDARLQEELDVTANSSCNLTTTSRPLILAVAGAAERRGGGDVPVKEPRLAPSRPGADVEVTGIQLK